MKKNPVKHTQLTQKIWSKPPTAIEIDSKVHKDYTRLTIMSTNSFDRQSCQQTALIDNHVNKQLWSAPSWPLQLVRLLVNSDRSAGRQWENTGLSEELERGVGAQCVNRWWSRGEGGKRGAAIWGRFDNGLRYQQALNSDTGEGVVDVLSDGWSGGGKQRFGVYLTTVCQVKSILFRYPLGA
jgi:hypothetical protein